MRVLLVGSGGREHALAWRLAQDASLSELHAAPGNPGIADVGICHPVRAEDAEGLLDLARTIAADLVVVGPEAPLVAGVADELRHAGMPVFGPSAAAARIEGSKSFAKDVMRAAGVPAAAVLDEPAAPCVVKLDGLAGGKGVFVCRSDAEIAEALAAAEALGGPVVVEELLEGEELSVFALSDGTNVVPLPAVRDYSRLADRDEGPNTGGMGAYSPVPEVAELDVAEMVSTIHGPVVRELAARGTPFVGALYAGVMLTAGGPRVLEFNCRFGDPETQALVPRLRGDLLDALAAATAGELAGVRLYARETAAVTVVLAAGSYPARGDTGSPIEGVEDAASGGALVFHAGTARRGDQLVTNGGRILAVTGVADTLSAARAAAYAGCEPIRFAGARYRRDIALAPGRQPHAPVGSRR